MPVRALSPFSILRNIKLILKSTFKQASVCVCVRDGMLHMPESMQHFFVQNIAKCCRKFFIIPFTFLEKGMLYLKPENIIDQPLMLSI